MDASFYDKYGAPVYEKDAWMEGYHAIELELAEHFNQCIDTETDFPLIGGIAGGAHIYKPVGHDVEPWNWTGWIPKKKIWCTVDKFHVNRYFLGIRGNEIQNNLWDYHPYQEQGNDYSDDMYEQITPVDSFQDKGYWLKDEPWARYIHIIALKSHKKTDGSYLRYNFIVHPLAYRGSINDVPDNTVDGTQWSILNIKYEKNDPKFTDVSKWGTDVHGLEIFNDFTYFYSWCCKNEVINVNNGTVIHLGDKTKPQYVYWHDTYPLEYGEFLLETSLERGVYFHAIAANDAYYNRDIVPPECTGSKNLDEQQRQNTCLLSDPKGFLLKKLPCCKYTPPELYSKKMQKLQTKAKTRGSTVRNSVDFLRNRPYCEKTAFGHTTLIDTELEMRKRMEGGARTDALDNAEDIVLKWFQEGKFFCHTGVYDLFNYEDKTQQIVPFVIENQSDKSKLCYEMSDDMELIFTFPRVKFNKICLVWRFTMQYIKDDNTFETVNGYFKMDTHHPTRLNLSDNFDKSRVKWIMFSAIRDDNPQRRAWFNPIRGLAFGSPKPNEATCCRTNRTIIMDERKITQPFEMAEMFERSVLKPYECKTTDDSGKPRLEFYFDKCSDLEEDNIYVYNMQVCANQPEVNDSTSNTSSDPDGNFILPERILQNVTGFFQLNSLFPTKFNFAFSWDPETVHDNTVLFYCIDVQTGQAFDIPLKPTVNMPSGCED